MVEAEGSSQARAWLSEERAGRQGTEAVLVGKRRRLPEEEWVSFEWKKDYRGSTAALDPLLSVLGLLQVHSLTSSHGLTTPKRTSLSVSPCPLKSRLSGLKSAAAHQLQLSVYRPSQT